MKKKIGLVLVIGLCCTLVYTVYERTMYYERTIAYLQIQLQAYAVKTTILQARISKLKKLIKKLKEDKKGQVVNGSNLRPGKGSKMIYVTDASLLRHVK